MAELKSFYEYFSKYPQDDALRDILQFAKVKKIFANKEERKLKAYILFNEYVIPSVVSLLKKNISAVYSLKEITLIDCYNGIPDARYISNVMEQLTCEIPVLSGYCDGQFKYSADDFAICVNFGGSGMLKEIKCEQKVSDFLFNKFGVRINCSFYDKEIEKLTYDQFKEKISVYEEKPEFKPVSKPKEALAPNRIIMGKKIEQASIDISDIRADSGMITVTGSVYGAKKLTLGENSQLMVFSVEDKTGAVDCKFFITDKTSEAADNLNDGDYIMVYGKAEEDMRSGGIILRPRSICGAVKVEREDKASEKRSELHIHSTMSSADGLATPEEIVERAVKWGLKSVAITDHGVCHSFPMAAKAAIGKDIKVICASEVYLVEDSESAVYGSSTIGFNDRFVVFDIETTGLSVALDRITEIGAVVVENGECKEVFSTFVNPKMKIPERITELTGITDAMVANAPDEETALKMFFDYAKDSVLVAHNANFDCGFMRAAARRCGLLFDYTYIDTVPICRSIFPELKSVKLNIVAEHIGAPKFKHHRAYDDANELAYIFIYLLNRLESSNGVHNVGLINSSLKGENVSAQRSTHATILAKNREGLKNLYRLISISHDNYYQKFPLVPKSILNANRNGLLIGSSCCDGELFKMLLDERSEEDLLAACRFYDYLEIQPLSNNMNMVDNGFMQESDQLRKMYTRLMQYAKMLDIPVVATSDAHFLEEEQEIVRDIALSVRGNRFDHSKGPIYFKTTDEMLADFKWVDSDTAKNLVINNPNMLADMCEDMTKMPDGTGIYEGTEKLRDLISDNTEDLARKDRLAKEIIHLEKCGTDKLILFAKELHRASIKNGYPCSFSGELSTYLCSFLLGLTDTDPYENGIDFSTNEKISVLEICILPEYKNEFFCCIDSLLGKDHYFYGSHMEYLAHDSVRGYIRRYEENNHTVVRENVARRSYLLMEKSKKQLRLDSNSIFIVPKNMDYFDFSPIHKVFSEEGVSNKASHFDLSAFRDVLVRIDFCDNPDKTVLRLLEYLTGKPVKDVPLTDNSVYSLFEKKEGASVVTDGLEGISASFKIREYGRPITGISDLVDCLNDADYAYTVYRLLWHKKNNPVYFYAAVLSAFADRVDKNIYFETRESLVRSFGKSERDDACVLMRAMYDMHQNGMTLSDFELYGSDILCFTVRDNKIIPPLGIIPEVSLEDAAAIKSQRSSERFMSVAELSDRCGLAKKTVEALRSKGLFEGLDENAQMSMFSLF